MFIWNSLESVSSDENLGVFGWDPKNATTVGIRTRYLPIARWTPYPLRHGDLLSYFRKTKNSIKAMSVITDLILRTELDYSINVNHKFRKIGMYRVKSFLLWTEYF